MLLFLYLLLVKKKIFFSAQRVIIICSIYLTDFKRERVESKESNRINSFNWFASGEIVEHNARFSCFLSSVDVFMLEKAKPWTKSKSHSRQRINAHKLIVTAVAQATKFHIISLNSMAPVARVCVCSHLFGRQSSLPALLHPNRF